MQEKSDRTFVKCCIGDIFSPHTQGVTCKIWLNLCFVFCLRFHGNQSKFWFVAENTVCLWHETFSIWNLKKAEKHYRKLDVFVKSFYML